MAIFFTSDLHFEHRNVIDYCKRPFVKADGQQDLELMHRTLIYNWNEKVSEDDTVYVLGDFSFGNKGKIAGVLAQLKGEKILIRGNHDRSAQSMLHCGFDEVYNNYQMDLGKYKIYLAHIPLGDPEEMKRKYKPEFLKPPPKYYDFFVCGHVHEKWRTKEKFINIGVDQWNFTPVSDVELLGLMDELKRT